MKTIFFSLLCLINTATLWAQIPYLHWSLNAGSTSGDFGLVVKTDNQGNVYTLGMYQDKISFATSTSIPIKFTALGSADAFLTKHNSDGKLVWAKSWGGTSSDYPRAMTLTNKGYIYIAGSYSGTSNFNPSGSKIFSAVGGTDIFISKFDTAGNFLWANGLGGSGTDEAKGVSCDNNDNVFVTGNFANTVDFDLTVDEAILTSKGKSDIFLLKLNSGGNCKWVKQIGGTQSDSASAISLDTNKHIIITGNFGDTADFDPDISESLLYSKGVGDAYIAKYDIDGNYIWAKSMKGVKNDLGNAIVTDNANNIYTTGSFRDTLTADASGTKLFAKGFYDDAYIAKHDAMGNLAWIKQFASTGSVISKSIALDNNDNIFLTGYFRGKTDFDPSTDSFYLIANSYYYDLFVCKLNNTGAFDWAFGYGGASADLGNSISVNNANSIFVTGAFNGTVDFDPTADTSWLKSTGHDDVFIMKLENYSLSTPSILSTKGDFSIAPNPTSGLFSINCTTPGKYNVAIYDVFGKQIINQIASQNSLDLDLSNQTNGIYFIKVWSEGQLIGTSKLLKQ